MSNSLRHIGVAVVALAFSSLISCHTSSQQYAPIASQAISWDKAAQYIGKDATVTGPVVGIYHSVSSRGSPTFIDLGLNYPTPGRFTVVIWGEDLGNFKPDPEHAYRGKTIYVRGVVGEYNSSPQIVVKSPAQIEAR